MRVERVGLHRDVLERERHADFAPDAGDARIDFGPAARAPLALDVFAARHARSREDRGSTEKAASARPAWAHRDASRSRPRARLRGGASRCSTTVKRRRKRCRSAGARSCPSPVLVGLAQFSFHHLARRRARDLVDEHVRVGPRIRREAREMRVQRFVRRPLRPAFSTTTASGRSPHFGCGDRDHRGFLHRRDATTSAFSRSIELIHSPPDFTRSLMRSVIFT